MNKRENPPAPETRRVQNITLVLKDGREVEGWYDSAGYYYAVGWMQPVDRLVIGWKKR
jgi:hypothetical protein